MVYRLRGWLVAGGVTLLTGLSACDSKEQMPTAPPKPNTPPYAGISSFTPGGQALVSATNVTLSANGGDNDGDSVTFNWSWGDGSTSQGATSSHMYTKEGTFTIALTVTDGKGATSNGGSVSVTVGSLTGNWLEDHDSRYGYRIVQDGNNLTGRRIDRLRGNAVDNGMLTGTVSHPRTVRFEVYYPTTDDLDTIAADVNPVLERMTYTIQPANVTAALLREK